MKKLLFTLFSIFTTIGVNAQFPAYEWAKNMGGDFGSARAKSVARDLSDNVYTIGSFTGSVDFNPGAGVFKLTAAGESDIFISKLDASGNFVWVKQLGGNLTDSGNGIAIEASGNICITGYFRGTADLDPGAGILNFTSAGDMDIFISKLNSSGTLLWIKQIGAGFEDYGSAITIDGSGNVLVTGYFQGTTDFDPGAGTYNLTANFYDIYIVKLSISGNFVWARHCGGVNADYGISLKTDASGNVYTTGSFSSTTDFDPGAGTFNLTSVGDYDIFILKLNSSGNFVWAKGAGGTGRDVGNCILLDASANVYVTGYFDATVDFDPGPGVNNVISAGISDVFVTKLDAAGNFNWVKQIGGTSFEYGYSMAFDGSGNIYLTGSFNGTVDFDPGAGTFNLTGNTDIYVTKLNASGNFVWAKQLGGPYFAGGIVYTSGRAITTDGSGNVYTAGDFTGTVDFDPGAGVFNLFVVSTEPGIFVSKLSSSGNFIWAASAGTSANTTGNSIATDIGGNVFTTGYFYGTVDFDPGAGIFNLSSDSIDEGNIFISKLDASGNFAWAKQIKGNTAFRDNGKSITTDASGNIYITGNFYGTADFDPGAGVFNMNSGGAGNSSCFILKLNSLGNFVWAKQFGNQTAAHGTVIKLDGSGNIYTIGYFNGITDFDPGPGTFNLTAAGSNDIFISKLDISGNFVWARSMGGTSSDYGRSLALDASGNVYLSGSFISTVDFDPGAGIVNLTSFGNADIFITKLNASGNFLWAKQLGGTSDDQGYGVAVDGAGNVYATGRFMLTADFDPGPATFNLTAAGNSDIFISKLDPSGNFVWAKGIGGLSWEDGQFITTDAAGYVYATGYFGYGGSGSTVDFDPNTGTYNLTTVGGADIFISKFDASGNLVWAKGFGGPMDDLGNSIHVDAAYKVYTTGNFIGTIDFNPNAGTNNLTSAGRADAFVQVMSQCILPSTTIIPSGSTTFCSPGSVILNASTGIGLTYQWMKNGINISGATGSSYNATTTGSYTVLISNACGSVTSSAIQVTASTALPSTPGSITTTGGIVKVCPGDIRTYTVSPGSGVTSYTWTPCAGSVITSGQNTNSVTIQYNANFPTSDTLRVVANNGCGTSAQRKLKISRNNPGTPSSITGDNFGVCNLSGIPYSITNVSGMTYAWSFNTGTATVAAGQGTSSIIANYGAGFVSGTLSVTASNACGTSAVRSKSIYAKPATPASITGATSVCVNQQDVPYSITPLANAANYTWVGPTGSHISDGINTSVGTTLITTSTSVTVDFATTAGSVKVRGNNACASGSYKVLSVAIVCREGEFSSGNMEVQVFPNPAYDAFTVETPDVSESFNLDVYDAYGRLIFSKADLKSGYMVNTNGWAQGVYSVVVQTKSDRRALNLVVIK